MTFDEFKIGERFWMSGHEWQCMDIATAHILAVKITPVIEEDLSWLDGPPYMVGLSALDAYDWPACHKSREEMEANFDQSRVGAR